MFSFGKKNKQQTRKQSDAPPKADQVQLVIMGAGGVGKSCLVLKMIDGQFYEDYDPTIEDTYTKQILVDQRPVLLDLVDTAGQEEFHVLEDQWIDSGECFILVFDATNSATVDSLEARRTKIVRQKDRDDTPVVIVANKMDLLKKPRSAATIKGKLFAEKWGYKYLETSALTNANVEETFHAGVRLVRSWRKKNVAVEPKPGPRLCTIL